MQAQVERLTKLSIDLLDLSRVDAGQLAWYANPWLSAWPLARRQEIEHLAASSDHAVEPDVQGARCLGDEARILQIGRALPANAITHTPPGTKVTIRPDGEAGTAELVVQDDGPGIPTSSRP